MQVPAPSQVCALFAEPDAQDAALQVVVESYSAQTPLEPHTPVVPQVLAAAVAQVSCGSVPFFTEVQMPSAAPVSAELHAWQVSSHGPLQHTPSTQRPDLHWLAALHTVPSAQPPAQLPAPALPPELAPAVGLPLLPPDELPPDGLPPLPAELPGVPACPFPAAELPPACSELSPAEPPEFGDSSPPWPEPACAAGAPALPPPTLNPAPPATEAISPAAPATIEGSKSRLLLPHWVSKKPAAVRAAAVRMMWRSRFKMRSLLFDGERPRLSRSPTLPS